MAPLKVRVMSKAPSPDFQLRSRYGIITCPSGMISPLNQATRVFASIAASHLGLPNGITACCGLRDALSCRAGLHHCLQATTS